MIWHIFKKDFKLLWPYAAVLAVLQLSYSAMQLLNPAGDISESGLDDGPHGVLQQLLLAAVLFGGSFLIASLVHQDAIPGTRQDWLVRPIPRMSLLLSKILSAVLLIHVPMLASDLLFGLVARFPLGTSLVYAISRNILLLMVLSMPLLAFSSLTKNLTEAVAGVFAMAVGMVMFGFITQALHWPLKMVYETTYNTGLHWVPQFAGYVFAFASALAVLGIQYFRRKTLTARVTTVVASLIFVALTFFLPWETASAVEEHFSRQPGASSAVSFSFDPTAGRIHRTPNRPSAIPVDWYLPLRVDGIAPDAALRVDRFSTRALFASGESMLLSIDTNADFLQNGTGRLHVGFEPLTGETAKSPLNDPRVKEQVMQIAIEMSATLLRRTAVADMTTLDGQVQINGTGCIHRQWAWYSDWDDDSRLDVTLSCAPVLNPVCYSLTLVNPPAPYVSIPVLKCPGDYKPYVGRLIPGASSITAVAQLYDPSGNVRYPENTEGLFQSKAFINVYEPLEHFTKTIVIPNIRFKDWTADPTPRGPAPQ